jgi:hypothetical protein
MFRPRDALVSLRDTIFQGSPASLTSNMRLDGYASDRQYLHLSSVLRHQRSSELRRTTQSVNPLIPATSEGRFVDETLFYICCRRGIVRSIRG